MRPRTTDVFRRRLSAALAGAALVFALGARGLCPMAPSAEPGDPHACCRAGVRSTPPSCCVDAPSADTPARETAALAPPVPADVSSATVTVAPARPLASGAVGVSVPGPSPPYPFAVLRI